MQNIFAKTHGSHSVTETIGMFKAKGILYVSPECGESHLFWETFKNAKNAMLEIYVFSMK